jgi:hypothetical protein
MLKIFIDWLIRVLRSLFSDNNKGARDEKYPYRAKDYLLSIAERKVFDILKLIADKKAYHLLFNYPVGRSFRD